MSWKMADVFTVLAEISACHFASVMMMLYNHILQLGTMSVHVYRLESCRGLCKYGQNNGRMMDVKWSNRQQNAKHYILDKGVAKKQKK